MCDISFFLILVSDLKHIKETHVSGEIDTVAGLYNVECIMST